MTSKEGRGGRRYLPYVFTEQGIAMLSAVLRSDIAIQVSIRIMETFVEMRKYMANTSLLYDRMNAIEERQITYQNETNEKFDKDRFRRDLGDLVEGYTEVLSRIEN